MNTAILLSLSYLVFCFSFWVYKKYKSNRMTATYFYSQTQQRQIERRLRAQGNVYYFANFAPNGARYIEMKTNEGEHKSNFEDAVIVQVIEDLPVNGFTLDCTGVRFAKTPPTKTKKIYL